MLNMHARGINAFSKFSYTFVHVFALCAHEYAQIFPKNFSVAHYSVINLSVKFHKDLIFRWRDICKIERCFFFWTSLYNVGSIEGPRTLWRYGLVLLYSHGMCLLLSKHKYWWLEFQGPNFSSCKELTNGPNLFRLLLLSDKKSNKKEASPSSAWVGVMWSMQE